VYCTVLTNTVTCIQELASKLSTNAKFHNLQDLNSRTFQGFSSTFKHLICFQALSRALKFLPQIQAFSRISQARYEPYVKNWVMGAGVVICLERGADLHMAQLMPLPHTISWYSKIQIGFTFLVPAHPGSPGKRAVKQVCVCVSQGFHFGRPGLTWSTP